MNRLAYRLGRLLAPVSPPRPLAWRDSRLQRMLVIAVILAVAWWAFAWWMRATNRALVWDDYRSTFDNALVYWRTPYQSAGYFALPWGMILLLPFDLLPFELATGAMILTYFILLALVVYKFGGGIPALLIALTSALAVDTALEINIDWMVVIGLLVPITFAFPFLAIKPQTALGYIGAFSRRELAPGVLVWLIVLLISLLIWGLWPLDLIANMRAYETNRLVNLAPMTILPAAVSIGIGVVLLLLGVIRRDGVVCILAWVFFTPYTAPNSVLVAFALASARWPRFAFVVSAAIWLIVLTLVVQRF